MGALNIAVFLLLFLLTDEITFIRYLSLELIVLCCVTVHMKTH